MGGRSRWVIAADDVERGRAGAKIFCPVCMQSTKRLDLVSTPRAAESSSSTLAARLFRTSSVGEALLGAGRLGATRESCAGDEARRPRVGSVHMDVSEGNAFGQRVLDPRRASVSSGHERPRRTLARATQMRPACSG